MRIKRFGRTGEENMVRWVSKSGTRVTAVLYVYDGERHTESVVDDKPRSVCRLPPYHTRKSDHGLVGIVVAVSSTAPSLV